jgi:diguanylate cyclase (GGDEF)-like protein
MTNLNNYRYFENRLVEEINRSRRNNTCVSLLMLDIDEFKNYNDELGHQAGDEALRTVGWILKNVVRDGDIVNRYGGEEFAIILPGMEKDLISILAERIRMKIDEHPFYKQKVQPGGSLTISLGGATFPSDADDFEMLVLKADKALYHSKKSGKNRCTIFDQSVVKH